jgi:hypothetical protein
MTHATSRDPPGGVKLGVVTGPAPVVLLTTPFPDASSASVPDARISSIANGPDAVLVVKPRTVAPPVTFSAWKVMYDSLLVASLMLSTTVALLPVAGMPDTVGIDAPYTFDPAVVVMLCVQVPVPEN